VTSLSVTASAPGKAGKIDPKNFEILGISLGRSTIEDVKRILGPAPERTSTDPLQLPIQLRLFLIQLSLSLPLLRF